MTRHQIKSVRDTILSRSYKEDRLILMHSEVKHWVEKEKYSRTMREKEFCRKMQTMYFRRYNWYLTRTFTPVKQDIFLMR